MQRGQIPLPFETEPRRCSSFSFILMKRFSFLLALFCLFFGKASSQQILRFSGRDSSRTIIVKLRSSDALRNPQIASSLASICASSDAIHPLFVGHAEDTSSLSRIIQIPLRNGVNVSDAVRTLASLNGIEYAEPNFRYR